MSSPMDGYAYLPKPRKPLKVDGQKINFGTWDDSSVDFDKKINYMMEMIKFMPDYERKECSGAARSEIEAAMKQYGTTGKDIYGNVIPGFGSATRSLSEEGRVRAYGQGYGIEGLQLNDESAGDFEHIEGSITGGAASESLIDDELWAKVSNFLKEDGRSYYDMMMDGVESKTDQEAFYLMAGMVESRNRIWNAMKSIVGTPGQSSEARMAVFNEWYETNNTKIGAGKIGFLSFFMDIQQSYISHSLPIFGASADGNVSELDRDKSEVFFERLSKKVSSYIGIDLDTVTDQQLEALPEEKKNAVLLWNKWVNPEEGFTAETNKDPLTEEWSGSIYGVLQKAIDQVLNMNVGIRSSNDAANRKNKVKMKEWEESVDEEKEVESRLEISKRKKQVEEKNILQKIQARSQAQNKQNVGSAKKSSAQNFGQKLSAVVKRMDAKKPASTAVKSPAKTPARTAVKVAVASVAKSPVKSSRAVNPGVSQPLFNPRTKQTTVSAKPAVRSAKVTGLYKSAKSGGTVAKKKWKSKLTIG